MSADQTALRIAVVAAGVGTGAVGVGTSVYLVAESVTAVAHSVAALGGIGLGSLVTLTVRRTPKGAAK